jgi:hypothetical protein
MDKINYLYTLPKPVIFKILAEVPQEQRWDLRLVSKFFKNILEGHASYPSLLAAELPKQLINSYCLIKSFSALKLGRLEFANNEFKDCILDKNCCLVTKSRWNTNLFTKRKLLQRLNKVAENIFLYSNAYAKSAKKDNLRSMLLLAERINSAHHALDQIEWIAIHAHLGEGLIDYINSPKSKIQEESISHFPELEDEENWGVLEKSVKISDTEEMTLSVCIKSLKEEIRGFLHLGNPNDKLTVNFIHNGQEIYFSALKFSEATQKDRLRCERLVEILKSKKSFLDNEIKSSKML